MKIIAIGDPHFKTDNITEVNLFIKKMISLVESENPDFIVVLGDVLHTHERLHTIPLNKAYEFIDKLRARTKVFVLVGNHDYTANCQFLTTNHWMNGMKEWKNVQIVDKVIHFYPENYHFVLCPYVPPGRFLEALDTEPDEWKKANIIFAHQEFVGCKMGAIISVDGDKWSEDSPPIISGHIHSKQTIKNVYYCGSSMQHAFGESDVNIIPIIELTDNKSIYKCREIDLELPRKKIIYTDVQSIEDYTPPKNDDKIKITITGIYDEFKSFKKTKKYRELISGGTKVVFKPKKHIKKDNKENIDKNQEEKKDEPMDEKDFIKILSSLINKEKNPYLSQVYESVVHDKNIMESDILFL